MKRTLRSLLLLSSLLLLTASCHGGKKTGGTSSTDTPQAGAYEQAVLTVEDARLFSIENLEVGHRACVFTPSGDTLARYLLLPKEAASQYTAAANEKVIIVPLQRMALLSDTFIGAAELLEAMEQVVATSDTSTLYNEVACSRARSGQLQGVSPAGITNAEQLVALSPDGIMMNYFEGSDHSLSLPASSQIPIIYNNDWQESTPLGRAEWIKFIGLLFGKGETASKIYQETKNRYESLRQKVLQQSESPAPRVLFGQAYKGVWYLPAEDSYVASFLRDAGAAFKGSAVGAPGVPISFEQVFLDHAEDDVWLAWHSADIRSYDDFLKQDKRYSRFKPFKERCIWLNSKRVRGTANDYFEQGPYKPDVILGDLVYIFHPALMPSDFIPSYWQRLE